MLSGSSIRFQMRFFAMLAMAATLWVTSPSAEARSLSLQEVLDKAMAASYDLKIAQTDIAIAGTGIQAARAEYFPTITARLNAEYLKDLEDVERPVVAVGNTVIPAGTRFQNSIGVNLQQNLYDFGARRRKLIMARQEVLSRTASRDRTLRDLQLKLVDVYTQALLNYKSLHATEAILTLAQQGYQMKKRLNEAGTTSKLDVATEAIQVAQAMDDIETRKQQLSENLQELGHYTHEDYLEDAPELVDLPQESEETSINLVLNLETSPEARYFDAQIRQKQREVEVLRRQLLPQFSLYSNYSIYGFDPDRWGTSLQDLKQRTWSAGIAINMPIFDGLKGQAAIQKAKLEKEKLVLERTKALLDLKHQASLLEEEVESRGVLLKTKATIVNRTQDRMTMNQRLSDQQIIDKTRAIQDHIERIRRQLEAETTLVQGIASITKLRILTKEI